MTQISGLHEQFATMLNMYGLDPATCDIFPCGQAIIHMPPIPSGEIHHQGKRWRSLDHFLLDKAMYAHIYHDELLKEPLSRRKLEMITDKYGQDRLSRATFGLVKDLYLAVVDGEPIGYHASLFMKNEYKGCASFEDMMKDPEATYRSILHNLHRYDIHRQSPDIGNLPPPGHGIMSVTSFAVYLTTIGIKKSWLAEHASGGE